MNWCMTRLHTCKSIVISGRSGKRGNIAPLDLCLPLCIIIVVCIARILLTGESDRCKESRVSKQETMRKVYHPEASKKAILDAAEELFAEKGFEAASIQEISTRAGVSRGT